MSELCSECAASFEEQSKALKAQCDEVSKRFNGLTQWLAKLTAQLATLHPPWPRR